LEIETNLVSNLGFDLDQLQCSRMSENDILERPRNVHHAR